MLASFVVMMSFRPSVRKDFFLFLSEKGKGFLGQFLALFLKINKFIDPFDLYTSFLTFYRLSCFVFSSFPLVSHVVLLTRLYTAQWRGDMLRSIPLVTGGH